MIIQRILFLASLLAIFSCGVDDPPKVYVNEVESKPFTPFNDGDPIRINEAASTNSIYEDEHGDSPDWFEMINRGTESLSLQGWSVSDKANKSERWVFPNVVLKSGEVLRVWASDKGRNTKLNKSKVSVEHYSIQSASYDYGYDYYYPAQTKDNLHASFKISAKGETLYLYNPDGYLRQSFVIPSLQAGLSFGHPNFDDDSTAYFSAPTPGKHNAIQSYSGYITNSIEFSHNGGASDEKWVSIAGTESNQHIRYTTDGAVPTSQSKKYTGPIPLEGNMVVRARAFQGELIPSAVISRAFLSDAKHDIPVVSLISEPDYFFDDDIGIYALGHDYEDKYPFKGANFWQDWEREVHFSFYDKTGKFGVDFDAGIKIFGGWTRGKDQKSLALFARKQYGQEEFEHPFFPNLDYDKFQSLVLRSSGNDWMSTMLRDLTVSDLFEGQGIDNQAGRPVAVYINAEYWGLHNLREKVSEHFLESKNHVEHEHITIDEFEGISPTFTNLRKFIANSDMSNEEDYQYVSQRIDISNFIKYQAAQIYIDNHDWPGNNIKLWKSPYTKWRWIMYDTDFSFDLNDREGYENNMLEFATATDSDVWLNLPKDTLVLRSLLENESFRNQFINQFADWMNSIFLSSNIDQHIDRNVREIQSEIPLMWERWRPQENDPIGKWENELARMKDFAELRPQYMKQHIEEKFELSGTYSLELINDNTDLGSIRVNSLTIQNSTWSGDYFNNIPVQLTAVPKDGYTFKAWEGDIESNQTALTLTPNSATKVRAVFSNNDN